MDTYRLRNGTEVRIRPIRPDDGERLQLAYASLSQESKYRRFLAAKPQLTSADTRYLVNVDGINHVALVAIAADAAETIVGVARFVRQREDSDDPELGELAIVVGDKLQRQGLGSELLRRLRSRAVAVGVRRLRGTMLAENTPAHRLVRGAAPAGGEIRERPRGYLYEIEIELPEADHGLELPEADHGLALPEADHGLEPAA